MLAGTQYLPKLSELSEQTPELRVLAARLEPLAEAVDHHVRFIGKYDGHMSDEHKAKTEAEKAAWATPGQELASAVAELRTLADKIDGALANTRALIRKEPD